MTVDQASFFSTQFRKYQNLAFDLSKMPLAFCQVYFFRTQTCKHQELAFDLSALPDFLDGL